MKKYSTLLNVAIIHPDLGIGGAERLIVDAAGKLVSHGHTVQIFTAHHDTHRCFEETISGAFPVTAYGSFLPRNIFNFFHAACAYIRCIYVALCLLLLWPSFDAILVDQVSIVIPFLKLKRSARVVFYCHFPDMLLASHNTALRRLYRKPINFIEETTTGMADMILVNSRFTASVFANTFKSLHARGIHPSVLHPAVNVDQFSHMDMGNDRDSELLNFLSINRFERKKNIELAILSLSMLSSHLEQNGINKSDDTSNITLTIAGGYDERVIENMEYLEELKCLAKRMQISDRVKFITSCSTPERNLLLSQSSCVIYTPKDEHFGIVPLEAMAAAKPVIACNSGGPTETIKDGVTGFLCDPTPHSFSLAMAKIVKHRDATKAMGIEARRHVSVNFSVKIFGDRLNQYLLDLCNPTAV